MINVPTTFIVVREVEHKRSVSLLCARFKDETLKHTPGVKGSNSLCYQKHFIICLCVAYQLEPC